MTCSNSSLYPSNSNDANFRDWGSALSAAISAAGWTQAGDTGQVNWTTVTAPTTASNAAGFEIWYMADALTRWYLKIEYGSAASALYPAVWITLGTGTNGTGTLSGQTSTRMALLSAASSATTKYSCAFAGSNNWLSVALWYDCSTSQSLGFMIERLKGTDGANADTGVAVFGWLSSQRYHQVIPLTGTIWTQNSSGTSYPSWPMMAPPVALTTSLSGTTIGLSTIHPWRQVHYPAILGGVAYYSQLPDISAYATFSASLYSTSHTYLALGTLAVCGTTLALAHAVRVKRGRD